PRVSDLYAREYIADRLDEARHEHVASQARAYTASLLQSTRHLNVVQPTLPLLAMAHATLPLPVQIGAVALIAAVSASRGLADATRSALARALREIATRLDPSLRCAC